MAYLDAPSFSLGLDELDQEVDALGPEELRSYCETTSAPSPNATVCDLSDREIRKPLSHVSSSNPASSLSACPSMLDLDDDSAFQRPVSPGLNFADNTVPVLKRLRRGPNAASTREVKQHVLEIYSCSDDEIEEFSPQLDTCSGNDALTQNHSVCGSSKVPLSMCGVLKKNNSEKNKAKHRCSRAGSSGLEIGSNKLIFSRLTSSPVRKFQLLDSDSEGSIGEHVAKNASHVESHKGTILQNTSPSKDLHDDFSPIDCVSIPTPALDEVCQEYFSRSKIPTQKSAGSVVFSNKEEGCDAVPPSHRYFFHEDPRIRQLVHARLHNFQPLADGNNMKNHTHDMQFVDYSNLFQQSCDVERSTMKRKKSTPVTESSASGNWVNPKFDGSCSATNAGKRRVHADCRSGYWFTDANGKKTYVDKSGEELKGKDAYLQYRKETCKGFKITKKKATTWKKTSTHKSRQEMKGKGTYPQHQKVSGIKNAKKKAATKKW